MLSKSSVFFSLALKPKAGGLNFFRFKERFRKAPFLVKISVDGRLNRRDKAMFSNSSDLMSVFEKAPFS